MFEVGERVRLCVCNGIKSMCVDEIGQKNDRSSVCAGSMAYGISETNIRRKEHSTQWL